MLNQQKMVYLFLLLIFVGCGPNIRIIATKDAGEFVEHNPYATTVCGLVVETEIITTKGIFVVYNRVNHYGGKNIKCVIQEGSNGTDYLKIGTKSKARYEIKYKEWK